MQYEEEEEVEAANSEEEKFGNRSRRMLFVRKVFATVGLELLICTAIITACYSIEPARKFFASIIGFYLGVACSFIWLGLIIAISCCKLGYGKPNACNISLLLLSTILLSVYTASFVVHFDIPAIMIAGATTVGTVLILTIITFHTKIDISGKGIYLIGGAIGLMLFSMTTGILIWTGVIPLTGTWAKILSLVLSGLMAVLLIFMILYHLKLIVGGGKYQYGEDDWLVASITLFHAIILLFRNILSMIDVAG